jgi:alkylhydroperoxidase family enzyme
MDTFLTPIEKPEGLLLKLTYFFTRRQFGKVLTPLKVHSARLPSAFGLFYGKISQLDKKLTLPRELVFLIRDQVARVTICRFCTDIGRWFSIQESMNQAKFDALEEYGRSPLFTDAERAALDYATELTKNKTIDPITFGALARHYSEREICEIVWLVASEHLYNLTNIGLNIHSDMLCDITKKAREENAGSTSDMSRTRHVVRRTSEQRT